MPDFTIDVPGFSDIIRLPGLESVELRRQQIRRMATRNTALPEPMQWIPGAINWLDDRQDILSLALQVGIPVLKVVMPRLVPVVGWGLLANDALNLCTNILGAAVTGRVGKMKAAGMFRLATAGKAARAKTLATFVTKMPWTATAITAGQVMRSATGYGLQLGGIMGMVTDSVWGAIRSSGGAGVQLRLPPDADPAMRAGAWLANLPTYLGQTTNLEPADQAATFATANAAMQLVAKRWPDQSPDVFATAYDTAATFSTMVWNPATEQAVSAEGGDPFALPIPPQSSGPTPCLYKDTLKNADAEWAEIEKLFAKNVGNSPWGEAAMNMAQEAADTAHATANDDPGGPDVELTPFQAWQLRVIELGVIPPWLMVYGDYWYFSNNGIDDIRFVRDHIHNPGDLKPRGILSPPMPPPRDYSPSEQINHWFNRSRSLKYSNRASFNFWGQGRYPAQAGFVRMSRLGHPPLRYLRTDYTDWSTGANDLGPDTVCQAALDIWGNFGIRLTGDVPTPMPNNDDYAFGRWYTRGNQPAWMRPPDRGGG